MILFLKQGMHSLYTPRFITVFPLLHCCCHSLKIRQHGRSASSVKPFPKGMSWPVCVCVGVLGTYGPEISFCGVPMVKIPIPSGFYTGIGLRSVWFWPWGSHFGGGGSLQVSDSGPGNGMLPDLQLWILEFFQDMPVGRTQKYSLGASNTIVL